MYHSKQVIFIKFWVFSLKYCCWLNCIGIIDICSYCLEIGDISCNPVGVILIAFQICLFFQFWLWIICLLYIVLLTSYRFTLKVAPSFFHMVCFKVRKESCLIVAITMNWFILFSHVMYCIIMYYKLILDNIVKSFHIYFLASIEVLTLLDVLAL